MCMIVYIRPHALLICDPNHTQNSSLINPLENTSYKAILRYQNL